jgi:hypothetical protein
MLLIPDSLVAKKGDQLNQVPAKKEMELDGKKL